MGLAELSHSDFNTSPKVNVSTTFDFREDSGLMDHDFIDNTGIADQAIDKPFFVFYTRENYLIVSLSPFWSNASTLFYNLYYKT